MFAMDFSDVVAPPMQEMVVAQASAALGSAETGAIGICFGVATCPADAKTATDLIEAADARLYESKAQRRSGRHAA